MERYRKERGFTLIERLVVLAIILVLMGILMPALFKALVHARKFADHLSSAVPWHFREAIILDDIPHASATQEFPPPSPMSPAAATAAG